MTQENNKQVQVSIFVGSLDEQQRMLVVLKSQLYGGQWGPMLEDLQNRLEGKPYIFKLANRIKDDVERIHQLQSFEKEHGIDLTNLKVNLKQMIKRKGEVVNQTVGGIDFLMKKNKIDIIDPSVDHIVNGISTTATQSQYFEYWLVNGRIDTSWFCFSVWVYI